MKKQIKGTDIIFYYEKLENGLEVIVIPLPFQTKYVTFSAKYGSDQLAFKINNEKEIQTPSGIAHFLEHKLFEQEKIAVFEFFDKTGADANANTSHDKTTYLFSSPDNFAKNLNFLLDYVQDPYLTDENVEKEKGIILQELKMRMDHNQIFLYESTRSTVFKIHPAKISPGGEIADVKKITKEDLMLCYNTFYHPSNMFVIISGDVDPDKTIDLVRKNQAKKVFAKPPLIELKKYHEPDEVAQKELIINRDVKTPKLTLNYKINMKHHQNDEAFSAMILGLFVSCVFDKYGSLNEKLLPLIEDDIDVWSFVIEHHGVISVWVETNHVEKVAKIINDYLQNIEIDKKTFSRKKKMILSFYLQLGDSTKQLNNIFAAQMARYGYIDEDIYLHRKNLRYEDFIKEVKKLNFTNYSKVIMQKNLQKK